MSMSRRNATAAPGTVLILSSQDLQKLMRFDNEPILLRGKPSAFFGTNLVGMLAFHGVDTVIVAGISTSGCVRATVVDAFSLNYRVIVPEECVADRVVVPHKVNLFDMQMKYADVLPLTRVIELLEVHADATHSK